MDVREKLVELLRNSPHLDVIKGYKGNDCTFEQGADWLIANGVTVQEWISVEDGLPTDEMPVFAYYGFDRGDGELGRMYMGTLSYFCFDPNPHWQHADHKLVVTHWMPKPQPPKGE